MNAADYAETINADALTNTGNGNIPSPIFSDAEIAEYEKTVEQIGRMLSIGLHRSKIINFP